MQLWILLTFDFAFFRGEKMCLCECPIPMNFIIRIFCGTSHHNNDNQVIFIKLHVTACGNVSKVIVIDWTLSLR